MVIAHATVCLLTARTQRLLNITWSKVTKGSGWAVTAQVARTMYSLHTHQHCSNAFCCLVWKTKIQSTNP
jgi:hypothetical protein